MTIENDRTHTVAIVDDSREDRYLLKRFLKKTELSLVILEAGNGQEAIDLLVKPREELQALHPDINEPVTIFLDINMPVMNGWEFLSELEKRHEDIVLKRTVIIMYSTSDAAYEKEKAKQFSTVANYIVKGETTPQGLRQTILDYQSET
ncbi:MAG: response regulator [Granulosicoccus sp.]